LEFRVKSDDPLSQALFQLQFKGRAPVLALELVDKCLASNGFLPTSAGSEVASVPVLTLTWQRLFLGRLFRSLSPLSSSQNWVRAASESGRG